VLRWEGLEQIPEEWGPSVVTVGVFDGVHRGHQHIIGRAVQHGVDLGFPVVAITFDPNPVEVVRPGSHPLILTAIDRRVELLGEVGADAVLVQQFTEELSRQTPEQFVLDFLVRGLRAAAVVVGKNFRYGHRAAGDVTLLERLGGEHGFSVEGLDLVTQDIGPVSSTYIRDLIQSGDVSGAGRALGRPHRVEGVVVVGDKRGRELGFPTANLALAPYTAVPADGIYGGWLSAAAGVPGAAAGEPARLPAAISIGTNPTFDGTERRVEAYALDRTDLELYGEHVAVDFAERLRETLKFDSVDALVEQMHVDVRRARALVESAGTGT
jgi:riboflavin kinase / FMN adenylyltransferase